MSYHDLHWHAKDGSWPKVDPTQALAKLSLALKPGAVVVVLDHAAAPGSDPAVSVDATHRIDPAIIKKDFEAAGLKFETESKAFANAEDDHTKPVFDPAVRHKTDQVLYRFRKT
jgi:predicted methyltransferase